VHALRLAAIAASAAALFLAIFVAFQIEPAQVRVEWPRDITPAARAEVERAHGLYDRRNGDQAGAVERFSYRLVHDDARTIARLLADARFTVIGGVDRANRRLERERWSLGWFRERDDIVAQPQSAIALAIALALMLMSSVAFDRVRRLGAVGLIAALTLAAVAVPITQPIEMGDYETYTRDRDNFDTYIGGSQIRFEAHLSAMLVRTADAWLGRTDRSPVAAFRVVGAGLSIWFGAMLLVSGWALGWTPAAVRYLALAVAAPVTAMFFGYREFGYLSLNPAVFPLLVTGVRAGGARFAAGAALAGVGAALHGFGLLALAGAAAMAVAVGVPVRDRLARLVQAFACGTAAYLIWVFVYIVGFSLDVEPGHTQNLPFRPLFANVLSEGRVNVALASVAGLREIAVAGVIAGVPLAVVGWRRREGFWLAAAYCAPSIVYLCVFWPVQGLALEIDLIVATFPAVYALAWLASHSPTASWSGVLWLAAGHAVLWRVVLGTFFRNPGAY
jgi:hypothetical protein